MGAALRYAPAQKRWEALQMDCTGSFSAISASERYMVFPCYELTGWSSETTEFGGLLIYNVQRRHCRRLAVADGLPNIDLRSVAMDGDKAWVGGRGFLAVVDLPSARIEKLCKLRAVHRVRCLELAGNDVWFSSGPALYRLSKDAH